MSETRVTQNVAQVPPRRRGVRRWIVWTGAIVVALIAAWVAVPLIAVGEEGDEQSSDTQPPKTVAVVRGAMTQTTTVQGEVGFVDTRKLVAGVSGTVTGLPDAGQTVGRGQALYAVDNVPVLLLLGELPAWRGFASGMSEGPDILQLEQNLQALGYFGRDPDTTFTWRTGQAIKRWQHALGEEQTGALPLGRVSFASGDLRIGEVLVDIGQQIGPGTEVLSVSGDATVVTANLKISDRELAVVGGVGTIRLPDGTEAKGKISSVGEATEIEAAAGTQVVDPVVIAFDDPAAGRAFDGVGVSVVFSRTVGDEVLQVPVTALLALVGGGLGVEVYANGQTRTVSVETGTFVGGLVEVSGGELAEGHQVVIP